MVMFFIVENCLSFYFDRYLKEQEFSSWEQFYYIFIIEENGMLLNF